MMKRFWVFILLFLGTGFTFAQDMPPLPSDAPASAAPAKDASMPALPSSATTTSASNDMPALPDAAASAAPVATAVATPAKTDAKVDASNDMPALPDSSGPSSAPSTATAAASKDMPALPDADTKPKAAASPTDSDMNAVPMDDASAATQKPHESKPWLASKERAKTIFGGWIKAKGGNITSKLSWASQQVLNALDAKKYKMANEEGVYEGEQNKGPQLRKFTFNVPKSKDSVIVLLKEVKNKIWLRVGPDEEPAPENHTIAEVNKIRAEDLAVLHIIQAKFGPRAMPHHMVPSWDAPYDRNKSTADEQ